MKERYLLILNLLAAGPLEGLYATDLLQAAPKGKLSRFGIYTDLESLVQSGHVEEKEVPASGHLPLPRTLHIITPKGRGAIAS